MRAPGASPIRREKRVMHVEWGEGRVQGTEVGSSFSEATNYLASTMAILQL